MQNRTEPQSIGEAFALLRENPSQHIDTWWRASLALTLVTVVYVFYQLISVGHASFNTSSDGVNWGIAVSTYVFFALISSGLTMIASLATVFGFKQFYPIAKRCIFLAIVTLVAGFSVLALELGHPFRMLWTIPTGMQVASPLFWMGVFYAIDLVLLFIKFYLMWRDDWDSGLSHFVGWAGLIAVILASGMLGLVFGSIAMRPMWFGSFTSIYFILTAALSGAAAIVAAIAMTSANSKSGNQTGVASATVLPKVLASLLGVTLVMLGTRLWVGLWSNLDGMEFGALIRTPLFHIELWLGLVLPFFMMLSEPMRNDPKKLTIAAFLVLGAMFIDRYAFVVSGQLVPMLKGSWTNSLVPYTPSVTEWALTLFGIGLSLALYGLGEKLFNLSATPPASAAQGAEVVHA